MLGSGSIIIVSVIVISVAIVMFTLMVWPTPYLRPRTLWDRSSEVRSHSVSRA